MDAGQLITASTVVAGVAGAVTAMGFALRGAWRTFRHADEFLEDWRGRPAGPGRARQPGVMERLTELEDGQRRADDRAAAGAGRLDAQDAVLAAIRAEVSLNSGHSVKDVVQEILRRLPASP